MRYRRLSAQAVREIREWFAAYTLMPKPREMVRRYGVPRERLYQIGYRKAYKAVQ